MLALSCSLCYNYNTTRGLRMNNQLIITVILICFMVFIDFVARASSKLLREHEDNWGKEKSLIWCLATMICIFYCFWKVSEYIIRLAN